MRSKSHSASHRLFERLRRSFVPGRKSLGVNSRAERAQRSGERLLLLSLWRVVRCCRCRSVVHAAFAFLNPLYRRLRRDADPFRNLVWPGCPATTRMKRTVFSITPRTGVLVGILLLLLVVGGLFPPAITRRFGMH